MPNANETEEIEVKETESEETTEETVDPESSQDPEESEESPEEEEETEETEEPENTEEVQIESPAVKIEPSVEGPIARVIGETPREYALRLEIYNLKQERRKEKIKGFTEPQVINQPIEAKKENEVLKKYKPEDVQSLREVLPILAQEMGYVSRDELQKTSYESEAQIQIDKFIEAHPEYSIDKDPDSTLWERLKSEYQTLYKPPKDPKDFKKIFERIHQDMFGIKVSGPLPKVNAAREKIKVASHSSNPAKGIQRQRPVSNTELRLDALKGFSEEDIADIQGRAGE